MWTGYRHIKADQPRKANGQFASSSHADTGMVVSSEKGSGFNSAYHLPGATKFVSHG